MKNVSHLTAILLALLVTFLWSTSFIIIKIGLDEIPPLLFAGLRYSLAFLIILPFFLSRERLNTIRRLKNADWRNLFFLGIVFYFLTQGAQFIGLALLPAVSVSLILNFTPVVVAFMGLTFLNERPTLLQWNGTLLFMIGILIYFYPVIFSASQAIGISVMLIGVLANAGASVMGRNINRKGNIDPLTITGVSMGIGSLFLISAGMLIEGIPEISFTNILLLIWLALINTALAFTLWNLSLRTLTAIESSIINGTMLIQIAILAWIFLDETVDIKEALGMGIAGIGAVIVQIRKKKGHS
jgi:drug/metabolite transporter (DMT)-like permease